METYEEALMEQIIKEIYSPSRIYKVVVIKRKKDKLFQTDISKWYRHDREIPVEHELEEGFWESIGISSSLTNRKTEALKIAIKELHFFHVKR